MRKKLNVLVLCGGKSIEHAVSLKSALSIIQHLDRNRFKVSAVLIDLQGKWHLNPLQQENITLENFSSFDTLQEVHLPIYQKDTRKNLIFQDHTVAQPVDIIFPMTHGPLYEDGCLQGYLELADVAYVGPGVLSSAIGMDKEVTKRCLFQAKILGVPGFCIQLVPKKVDSWIQKFHDSLKFPLLIKNACSGSSIGNSKVKKKEELKNALLNALQYGNKILVETFIPAREIEVSVLENQIWGEKALASIPGEIIVSPNYEFYDYSAKYLDPNGATLSIPAELTEIQIHEIQQKAIEVFHILGCSGMARVDFLLHQETGELFVNEVNTIPGFTPISMYPKLWEFSGISYTELLTQLIDLGIARYLRKKEAKTFFQELELKKKSTKNFSQFIAPQEISKPEYMS